MARARELLSSREACGPGPHDRDGLAGSRSLQHGLDPALVESFVNDVPLDDPDRHRIRVDAEDTGRLTRRRAEASSEFREVVRRVQRLEGVFPPAAVDEIVPLGD